MEISVSELSKKTGISVRTLHYYDQIGLLEPSSVNVAGYRLYNEDALCLLQQVLFFKELEFSLSSIKNILLNPEYDKLKILEQQRHLLILKKKHLEEILSILDDSIEHVKVNDMTISLKDISKVKKDYAKEIRKHWDFPENKD
ncbi:MAG: MerR family transcriptional regulator [bacterium]